MIQSPMQSIPNGRRWNGSNLRGALRVAGLAVCFLPLLCPAQTAPTYTISAAVGNGTAGFSGDGAAATDAEVNFPAAMFLDGAGNLYIADQANFRIRQVDVNGIISTIAGTGTKGDTGNGDAATKAELSEIGGITLDSSGNIYLCETDKNYIRKIDTSGKISAFAGTGTAGFTGDTTAYTIAYNKANNITTVTTATSAEISAPTGIAVDSKGNVYFSDTSNNRIRMISATDSTITTVAGDGTGAYYGDGAGAIYSEINHPTWMVFDASDNLYFCDSLNHRVRKIAADDSRTITTVAGLGSAGNADNGGLAVNAQLHYPSSVALDSTGNIYIADFINNRVRMVTTNGVITTIAGNGKFGNTGDGGAALDARMYFPCAVVVDGSGNVYVIDSLNTRIRLLTPDQTGTTTDQTDPTTTGTARSIRPAPPVHTIEPVRTVRPVRAAE